MNMLNGLPGNDLVGDLDREDLAAYGNLCWKTATQFINTSTRHAVTNPTIISDRPANYHFLITVDHRLTVSTKRDHYKGQADTGPDDIKTYNDSDNQSTLNRLYQAELDLCENQTLHLLTDHVQQGFATFQTETIIRSHPSHIHYITQCERCSGRGRNTCHRCSGRGQVSCSNCNGSGKMTCWRCNGSGRVQVQNGYGTTQYEQCYCTFGQVNCNHCHSHGTENCSNCRGTGHVMCADCAGTGCFTTVTSIHTCVTPHYSIDSETDLPDYVQQALNKVGIIALPTHGKFTAEHIESQPNRKAVLASYGVSVPFCALDIDIGGAASHWILFGDPPQIFDAAGTFDQLLQNDLAALATQQKTKYLLHPKFSKRIATPLKHFFSSKIHCDVLEAANANSSIDNIHDAVNRALTKDYIESALLYLKRTFRAMNAWARLNWTLATILCSLPLTVLLITSLECNKPHVLASGADTLELFPKGDTVIPALIAALWGFCGWVLAYWSTSRRLRHLGGTTLATWVRRNGWMIGGGTLLFMITALIAFDLWFFTYFPIWIDNYGQLYGGPGIFDAPTRDAVLN